MFRGGGKITFNQFLRPLLCDWLSYGSKLTSLHLDASEAKRSRAPSHARGSLVNRLHGSRAWQRDELHSGGAWARVTRIDSPSMLRET
jgi:hypothetical protein